MNDERGFQMRDRRLHEAEIAIEAAQIRMGVAFHAPVSALAMGCQRLLIMGTSRFVVSLVLRKQSEIVEHDPNQRTIPSGTSDFERSFCIRAGFVRPLLIPPSRAQSVEGVGLQIHVPDFCRDRECQLQGDRSLLYLPSSDLHATQVSERQSFRVAVTDLAGYGKRSFQMGA